jgi:AbrB family looped-hinge helix DNA binding protein
MTKFPFVEISKNQAFAENFCIPLGFGAVFFCVSALHYGNVRRSVFIVLHVWKRSMETVTLSTKGQLVIPASVRGALRLKAGNRLSVSVEGGNIVLKPDSAQTWKPLNPAGARLGAAELSRPVDLKHEARRS